MIIIDVREKDEFLEGHLKGAINIPLSNIMSSVVIQSEKFSKSDKIIVYCRSGNRSAQAIRLFKSQGYNNLINGIDQKSTQNYIDSLKDN